MLTLRSYKNRLVAPQPTQSEQELLASVQQDLDLCVAKLKGWLDGVKGFESEIAIRTKSAAVLAACERMASDQNIAAANLSVNLLEPLLTELEEVWEISSTTRVRGQNI